MKMSRILTFFISISALTVMLYFSGCGSNSTTAPPPSSTTTTVNGKLIDYNGTGMSGLTISIGGQTAISASDGSFTINNVNTPYDLRIISGGVTGIVYKGLTTSTPQAYCIGVTTAPNSALVTVNVPATVVPLGKEAIVIFTDTLNIQQGSFIVGPNTTATINVQWPGSVTLPGKVIVLVANVNANGNITGYSVYGEKTYTLNNGSPATITFGAGDFPINPGSATVSGTVNIPSGYVSPISHITMAYVPSSILYPAFEIDASGPSYSFTVPTGLPTSFKLYLEGSSSSGQPQETTFKMMNVIPGSSGNSLDLDAVPALSTPANNAVGVDTSTIFTYSSTSGTGIYILTVTSATKHFYILTSSMTANIPNLAAYGLTLGSSVSYQWGVQRVLGVSTTDNFVSGVFRHNSNFIGLTGSSSRSFTSAP